MAEKRKYNAKMNAKGLEGSVSEDQARHMALHQGHTYVFLVQAHSGPKTVAEDGSESVSLIPDLVEMVPAEHEERIREFQRALYLARPGQHGQEAFEAATAGEPGIPETAGAVDALVERDDSGNVVGLWDGKDHPPQTLTVEECPYPGCVREEHDDDNHEGPGGVLLIEDPDDEPYPSDPQPEDEPDPEPEG